MEKKLLIGGSAIAVVVLVLASLSPVVGFHTVKSTSTKNSPLFSIRTNRAVNKETTGTFISDYIGKGGEINIIFPLRNNKDSDGQKIIDKITAMNDEELHIFINLIIKQLQKYTKTINIEKSKIISLLYNLKDNPEIIEQYVVGSENNDNSPQAETLWFWSPCTYGYKWFPGCYLEALLIELIVALIIFIIAISGFSWIWGPPMYCHPSYKLQDCKLLQLS